MIRTRLAWLKHLIGALLALTGLLCAVESGLRIYDSYTGTLRPAEADGPGLTVRSWRMHHRLTPLQRHAIPEPDAGTPVELAVNSCGVRGPEIAVPKPPGVYRIICLGDEVTLAADVPEPETFCARLQMLLQPHTRLQVEVVNAGVPGYCPLLSYLQLKHVLLSLQPDLVLLNFDMSDIADDHRYRRFTQVDVLGVPIACPHPDLSAPHAPRESELTDYSLLARWAKGELAGLTGDAAASEDLRDIDTPQGRYAWLKDSPPDWSVYIRQALEPIGQLHRTTDQVYARLVVVVCPAPWQVSAAASEGARDAVGIPPNTIFRSRGPSEVLASWLDSQRIPLCDLSVPFQQADRPERLYIQNAARLSRAGHELYARQTAAFLRQTITGIWSESPDYAPEPPMPTRQARAVPGL